MVPLDLMCKYFPISSCVQQLLTVKWSPSGESEAWCNAPCKHNSSSNSNPPPPLVRQCGLAVATHSILPNGAPSRSLRRCGATISGNGANDVARNLEAHVSQVHDPKFRREADGKEVCECLWLMDDGTPCGTTLKRPQNLPSRPCYALAQHIGKATDHFGLWASHCTCHKQAFVSRDSRKRHEAAVRKSVLSLS